MGQIGSTTHRRRHHHHHHHQTTMTSNNIVFAAATPYPQYPNPNIGFYHYPRHDQQQHRYPYGHVDVTPPQEYVEHHKTVTIRNDVNLKKETLRIQPDEQHPGSFLVCFTFDATVSGSIRVVFFGKEGEGCCSLTSVKEKLSQPMAVEFEKGSAQKFVQPFGSGIDLSMFEEGELVKAGETGAYPLAVIAQAAVEDDQGGSTNSQITLAVFEKEKGGFQVRVVKQILFVQGQRYELQEIYGIGNSVGDDFDGNDPGKECVICLSEPRDTAVLPCRHMCMCSGCARVLRSQTNRCPICRQLVDRLLEIKVNNSNYNGTGK